MPKSRIISRLIDRAWKKMLYKVRCRPICFICLLTIIGASLIELKRPDYDQIYTVSDSQAVSEDRILPDKLTVNGRIISLSNRNYYGSELTIATVADAVTEQGKMLTHSDSEYVTVWFPRTDSIHVGQNIRFSGKPSVYEHATNPGQFDAYDYYYARGDMLRIKDAVLLAKSKKYSKLKDALYNTRIRGESILTRYLNEDDAAIMKAMIFGNKNEISEDTRELFQKNGIAHILAISGLHISFLAMGLFKLLKRIGMTIRSSACISEVALIMYGIMVGMPVSAFRAICMFTIYLVGCVIFRAYDMLTAMSVALIFVVIRRPSMLSDVGLRLSFEAVFAVGYMCPAFEKNIAQVPTRLKGVLVSLMVFLATIPTLLAAYYEVAFYSVILNLVIIPLMSVLLVCAIVLIMSGGILVGLASSGIFATCNLIARFPVLPAEAVSIILMFYKKICAFLEGTWACRWNLGAPRLWQIVVYYVLIIIILNFGVIRKTSKMTNIPIRLALFAGVVVMGIGVLAYHPTWGLGVWMLDVGQGDCMLIRNSNGHMYIIDGGSSSVKEVGKQRIIPALKYMGVNKVEGIFLTHPDEDHMNGLVELIEQGTREHIAIKHIYTYRGFVDADEVKLGEEPITGLVESNVIKDGPLTIRVLYPYDGCSASDANNASLVMKVEYGDFCMLTTGDVEKAGEQYIVRNWKDTGDIDVLKVAHHGSDSSTTREFLRTVKPKYALISAPLHSKYGHPHKATLDRLDDEGAVVLRTDRQGCISLEVNVLTQGDISPKMKGVKCQQ